MSLQTGQSLAQLDVAIVNLHNLKIMVLYVNGPIVDFAKPVENYRGLNAKKDLTVHLTS